MSDLLNVDNLTVRFEVKRGGSWGRKSYLYAVDDISFAVKKGETLAIVGEAGQAKRRRRWLWPDWLKRTAARCT